MLRRFNQTSSILSSSHHHHHSSTKFSHAIRHLHKAGQGPAKNKYTTNDPTNSSFAATSPLRGALTLGGAIFAVYFTISLGLSSIFGESDKETLANKLSKSSLDGSSSNNKPLDIHEYQRKLKAERDRHQEMRMKARGGGDGKSSSSSSGFNTSNPDLHIPVDYYGTREDNNKKR